MRPEPTPVPATARRPCPADIVVVIVTTDGLPLDTAATTASEVEAPDAVAADVDTWRAVEAESLEVVPVDRDVVITGAISATVAVDASADERSDTAANMVT